MKHVFVVDDNPNKLEDLENSVTELFPEAEISAFECMLDFEHAICHTFASKISQSPGEYLMVLDMQMPFKRDGRINADAGFELLNILFRHDLKCPAIIASSEEIDEETAEKIYEHYKGFVRYDSSHDMTSAIAEVLGINNS